MRSEKRPLALAILLAVAFPASAATAPDPTVQAMIDGVSREELEPVVNELSGETPATISGAPYTFSTRSSSSGVPIDMAEQYIYEQLLSYGLDSVVFQEFPGERGAPPGRNIIAQIDGASRADEIIVLGAHLDNQPWSGLAPGADDDASGVSAILLLARSFSGTHPQRTLRFAIFGDEENAPWDCEEIGSAGYAARCRDAGEDIVAMIEADAIAFNPPETQAAIVEMHARAARDDPTGQDLAIIDLWQESITLYSIGEITPRRFMYGNNWSDHGSFWNQGYPATLLIAESTEHWNPNWHTARDRVSTFDWAFYVQVTRSLLALAAELALMEEPSDDTDAPDSGPEDTELDDTWDSAPSTDDSSKSTPGTPCACGSGEGTSRVVLLALFGLFLARARPRSKDPRRGAGIKIARQRLRTSRPR